VCGFVRGRRGKRLDGGFAVQVEDGSLEDEAEQAGALEVDAVGGEAGGDIGVGALDCVAVVEVLDEEWIVLDDGGSVAGAVDVAVKVVEHRVRAAAFAGLLGVVRALVRFGRFAIEVLVAAHSPPPRCLDTMLLIRLQLRRGSDEVVTIPSGSGVRGWARVVR
jgi:hypothetical protein